MTESRTERITLRWPLQIHETLVERARARGRSVSAEVRELLTYARNTIQPETFVQVESYSDRPSTSVSLTPRLRSWLFSRAQYHDRTVQMELLMLVTFALEHIMERDLAWLTEMLGKGLGVPAPE